MTTRIIKDIPTFGILDDHASMLNLARLRMAKILMRQERATILWIRGTSLLYVPGFELPFSNLLRNEVTQIFLVQYRAGGHGLERSLGLTSQRTHDSGRVRAKAKVVGDRLVNMIENELKSGWMTLATTKQNKLWWEHHTRTVFAQLGGWDIPDGF